MNEALAMIEAIVDEAAVAPHLEAALPNGVRKRQLCVRTLLVGILLVLKDGRPAHLVRVHRALLSLDDSARWRLGVLARWRTGSHLLTYRQVEHTFSLVVVALLKQNPDGAPSQMLSATVDALVEASVPARYKSASSSLAVDWSDYETFSCPPVKPGARCADPEASWGHRSARLGKEELFFGYFFHSATMVRDEQAAPVPELVRRMSMSTCSLDAPVMLVAVLERLVSSGVHLGDILCDSGYAHRLAHKWALPVRKLGGALVMDLHPHDRGVRGTYKGAISRNGNLYCPATPEALLGLEPLGLSADEEQTAVHDLRTDELARYKLGRVTKDDEDGYHRVMCPAAMGKVRCSRKPASLELSFERPEVFHPPEPAPDCCTQKTITVTPQVNAKTAQKHDYPSKAHRTSFRRRTAVERSYSTMKDPALTDISRGWCRLMGLCAITLFVACAVVVRNTRVVEAFEQRTLEDAHRQAVGIAPRVRKRRRRTLDDLVRQDPTPEVVPGLVEFEVAVPRLSPASW